MLPLNTLAMSAALALAPVSAMAQSGWTFERRTDNMTGAIDCAAISPVEYLQTGAGQQTAPVRLVIRLAGANKVLASIRVDTTSRGLLHPNASGSGVKVEPGAFHATSARAAQTEVHLANSSQAVDELLLGKTARLRVKFWPYDRLVDSEPISLRGLPQAVLKVAECAQR